MYFDIILKFISHPISILGPLIRIKTVKFDEPKQNMLNKHVLIRRPNERKAKQSRKLKREIPHIYFPTIHPATYPPNIERQLVVFSNKSTAFGRVSFNTSTTKTFASLHIEPDILARVIPFNRI